MDFEAAKVRVRELATILVAMFDSGEYSENRLPARNEYREIISQFDSDTRRALRDIYNEVWSN